MTAALKILLKDIEELSRRPNLLLLLALVACLFLLIAGNLRPHSDSIRILFVAPDHSEFAQNVEEIVRAFDGTAVRRMQRVVDVQGVMETNGDDIAVVWQDGWTIYEATPPGARQDIIRQRALQLSIAIRACLPWHVVLVSGLYGGPGPKGMNREAKTAATDTPRTTSPDDESIRPACVPRPTVKIAEQSIADAPQSDSSAADKTSEGQNAVVPFVEFYRGAAAGSWLIPAFLALLTLFVPFLIACNCLVRELELGTLETLLTMPGTSWLSFVVGKALLPVLSGLALFAILLVFAQGWFGLQVRAGITNILGLYFLGIVAATLYGLLTASLIGNQLQGYFASAAYLLASILLTGLLFPLTEAAGLVQFVAPALPLTWAYDPLARWLLAGIPLQGGGGLYGALWVQIAVLSALNVIGMRFARGRI